MNYEQSNVGPGMVPCKKNCRCDDCTIERLQARVRVAEQREAELVRLLKRYRHETPLGHQPHMIAAEVDGILATHESQNARSGDEK